MSIPARLGRGGSLPASSPIPLPPRCLLLLLRDAAIGLAVGRENQIVQGKLQRGRKPFEGLLYGVRHLARFDVPDVNEVQIGSVAKLPEAPPVLFPCRADHRSEVAHCSCNCRASSYTCQMRLFSLGSTSGSEETSACSRKLALDKCRSMTYNNFAMPRPAVDVGSGGGIRTPDSRPLGRPRKYFLLPGETSPAVVGRRLGIPRQRADRLLHPEQWAARQAVAQALIKGKLVTPDACERCGDSEPLQAHHADYTKKLEVRWLCRPCHNIVHPHTPGSRQRRRRPTMQASTPGQAWRSASSSSTSHRISSRTCSHDIPPTARRDAGRRHPAGVRRQGCRRRQSAARVRPGGVAVTPVSLWFLVTLLRCGYLPKNLRTRMAVARAFS